MIVARQMPWWPGPVAATAPALTDQAWLDWAVLDFTYQAGTIDARASAARRGIEGTPGMPDGAVRPNTGERSPSDLGSPEEGA